MENLENLNEIDWSEHPDEVPTTRCTLKRCESFIAAITPA